MKLLLFVVLLLPISAFCMQLKQYVGSAKYYPLLSPQNLSELYNIKMHYADFEEERRFIAQRQALKIKQSMLPVEMQAALLMQEIELEKTIDKRINELPINIKKVADSIRKRYVELSEQTKLQLAQYKINKNTVLSEEAMEYINFKRSIFLRLDASSQE